MEGNCKIYVDRMSYNYIALLLNKNNQDRSYQSDKTEKSRRIAESRPVCVGRSLN